VHRTITDPANVCYLSPISIWELIVLLEKRRVEINQDFGRWFEQSRVYFDLKEAPLDWKVVHEVRFVMLRYKDPADRFLAATARAYDFTLVTADERLLRVPDLKTLANL
jgi:PIN domain nuclease of toxin-antitoxin system